MKDSSAVLLASMLTQMLFLLTAAVEHLCVMSITTCVFVTGGH